ncbi:hypothetical protein NBRC116583_19360 [Arenicella sp. 4NH20-0111]|uniref:excalibur calcium-binding domain-containing protein n=1 Tax=Arenicella sp. 4NH20-0111 TaxID=3127648 RepID=UPI0031036487
MKILLVFIVLIAASSFYFSPSISNKISAFSNGKNVEEKCTTSAGKVYYGDIPEGVVCQTMENVDTSITVVKSLSQNVTESPTKNGNNKCDGRRYCSQMTSCSEAKYYLKHCPNTSMDGNNDGIPCEKQWCKF